MKRVVAVLAVAWVGCGKTNATAIEELKPTFAQVRTKLARMAKLSGDGSDQPLTGAVFDETNENVTTMSLLMPQQVADPDFSSPYGSAAYVKLFDPIAGGRFLMCLNWTGPKNPMGESAMSARHGEQTFTECQAAADLKVLVIVETLNSVVPTLVEEGKFEGGRAEIGVTVIDFKNEKVLSRFTVKGEPDQVVKYRVRPGETKAIEAAIAVHGTMWVDARAKLFAGLQERGASIHLR